jgi:hypothetical protein
MNICSHEFCKAINLCIENDGNHIEDQHSVPLQEKLYGDAGNLELTAVFIRIINLNV